MKGKSIPPFNLSPLPFDLASVRRSDEGQAERRRRASFNSGLKHVNLDNPGRGPYVEPGGSTGKNGRRCVGIRIVQVCSADGPDRLTVSSLSN